ncbi:MAG: 50S ribosomal protein L2 [Planctomycetes bacterium]|nr:50S ribosomal protein L2 [Planctomycetota bacterium]
MGIKFYRPTSAARRHGSVLDFSELTKCEPEKSLLEPQRKTGGRNNHGHITSRHIGGGHKQKYRIIDFKRDKDTIPAKVAHIEYDPNRSARIALLHYNDGEKRYILAPVGLNVGDNVESGVEVEPKVGNSMPLAHIPVGLEVHNIEQFPGSGGKIARSAGMAARLSAREGDHALLVMPSGELRKIHINCRATIGRVGNLDHQNVSLGKAGRARHMGRRPKVRGVAQNPVAHPMGGGEGRSAGGRASCSPTGVLSKGGKTRKRNNPSARFILRRRPAGPHYRQG